MVRLQWYDGKKWIDVGKFHNNTFAWMSLGSDNLNYRTMDENDKILKDTSEKKNG